MPPMSEEFIEDVLRSIKEDEKNLKKKKIEDELNTKKEENMRRKREIILRKRKFIHSNGLFLQS